MLYPRACDTMTDATAFLSVRCREARKKADFGSLKAPRPDCRDRTGRNVYVANGVLSNTLVASI